MRVGIVQPNFIPWRGYFDFISEVDLFVFYDDIVFGTGKKWRNRNLIRTDRGSRWLTVPLKRGQGSALVHEVMIDYSVDWIDRHLSLIRQWYSAAPYYFSVIETFARILRRGYRNIADLDVDLCLWLMSELNIRTETIRSRDLGLPGADKRVRPLSILWHLGATEYVIGPGALGYTDAALYRERGIRVEIKSYDYPPYRQLFGGFDGNVSIIDLLMNVGPDAGRLMCSQTPNAVLVPGTVGDH